MLEGEFSLLVGSIGSRLGEFGCSSLGKNKGVVGVELRRTYSRGEFFLFEKLEKEMLKQIDSDAGEFGGESESGKMAN